MNSEHQPDLENIFREPTPYPVASFGDILDSTFDSLDPNSSFYGPDEMEVIVSPSEKPFNLLDDMTSINPGIHKVAHNEMDHVIEFDSLNPNASFYGPEEQGLPRNLNNNLKSNLVPSDLLKGAEKSINSRSAQEKSNSNKPTPLSSVASKTPKKKRQLTSNYRKKKKPLVNVDRSKRKIPYATGQERLENQHYTYWVLRIVRQLQELKKVHPTLEFNLSICKNKYVSNRRANSDKSLFADFHKQNHTKFLTLCYEKYQKHPQFIKADEPKTLGTANDKGDRKRVVESSSEEMIRKVLYRNRFLKRKEYPQSFEELYVQFCDITYINAAVRRKLWSHWREK
ncbi:hypothetical protein BC833DRAFT_640438, partial [Globomyces pollinis-pini]